MLDFRRRTGSTVRGREPREVEIGLVALAGRISPVEFARGGARDRQRTTAGNDGFPREDW
jgi:hypothetical protein